MWLWTTELGFESLFPSMDKGKLILDGYPVFDAKYENGHKYKTYRELRLLMLEKHNTCYWCHRPVFDYPYVEGVETKPDMATIDHLIQRPTRKKGQIVGKVIACYKCNIKRSRIYGDART